MEKKIEQAFETPGKNGLKSGAMGMRLIPGTRDLEIVLVAQDDDEDSTRIVIPEAQVRQIAGDLFSILTIWELQDSFKQEGEGEFHLLPVEQMQA